MERRSVLACGASWSAAVVRDGPLAGCLELVGPADPPLRRALEEVHGAPSRFVPGLLEARDERVVVDVRPLGTLTQLLQEGMRQGVRLAHRHALALGAVLAQAWRGSHAVGASSGRVQGGQIVLDAAGVPAFVGLGTALDLGRTSESTADPFVGVAPEVIQGLEPDRRSDVYASVAFATTTVAAIDMPRVLLEALDGEADAQLIDTVRWLHGAVLTHRRADRVGDLAEVLARFEAAGLAVDVEAALAAMAPLARTLLAPRAHRLRAARDGSWIAVAGGPEVPLTHRAAPRRILARLLDARERGEPVSAELLIDAGWPGQRILPQAARGRLHVAISTLRKTGLGEWLLHDEDGYRIAPDVAVELEG